MRNDALMINSTM